MLPAGIALAGIGATVLLAGCSAGAAAGHHHSSDHPASSAGAPTATATTASTDPGAATGGTTTTTAAVAAAGHRRPRLDDGSLGYQATRAACRLLTRAEIAAAFGPVGGSPVGGSPAGGSPAGGSPVGPPTPAYPDCEWLVGATGWLALDYQPGVSYPALTQWTGRLETVTGVGQHAEIGDNRYIYFTAGADSYWLLWQQVGDFSSIHEPQLAALARDVLARAPLVLAGRRRLGPLPAVPRGPPIYFAGDSTAAGPEWAWVTYHTALRRFRTLAEYQVGSGLVVPGYFDWPRHLLAVTAEERPRLVIYMGSANDGQDLPYGTGYAAPGSPGWRKVYGERVGATMSELTAEGAKVLWIGEPAMQSPSLSADMLAVDQVCAAEAASHRGVTFLNPGTFLNLPGPGWRYTPDAVVGGRRVEVRLDGIHLNGEGSILLADEIAPVVARILGRG